MSSEVTLLDSERSREFEDNDEETDGPVGKGQLEEETRVTSSKSTPGNEGFKESSIARVEQESLNSLLVEKVSHVEKLLERIMGHSMRIVVIKNDKQRKQIERLLCTCCKLILRDAVQTVEGLRLCLCCAVYITKLPDQTCIDCKITLKENEYVPDFAGRKEVCRLNVVCVNNSEGCTWRGILGALQEHLKACEYKAEQCELCDEAVVAKFMEKHLKKQCNQRQVACTFCAVTLKFCEIEGHYNSCPSFPVSCTACEKKVERKMLEEHKTNECEYKECVLCKEQVLRTEFKQHIKDNAFDHFELLADEFTTVKKELDELKAATEQGGTKREVSLPGDEHSPAKLWATIQTALENTQFLRDRLENVESIKVDMHKQYDEERKRQALLEDRIEQLEQQNQVLAVSTSQGHVTQMGRELDAVNYKMSTTRPAWDSSTLSVSSGLSSIDDMDTRLTNLEHKVKKVYARDADFDKRTSNLEETVRVLQNTLTDIHPTDKGFQAVVRAGEIVPQDKQQTYLMEKRMGELEQQVTTLSTQCTDLELQLQASLVSTYNGDFLWRIPDVSRRIRDAKTGKITSIYSPPFFTSRTGYKMCIRAYLNGDGMGEKTHLSLFFVIMKGEFDALLSWPFQSRITLTLINQDNRSRDVREVFRANPQSKSFQRPTSEMNVASGCPKFASLEYLNNPSYVKQDVLYIRCLVDTSFLTHP